MVLMTAFTYILKIGLKLYLPVQIYEIWDDFSMYCSEWTRKKWQLKNMQFQKEKKEILHNFVVPSVEKSLLNRCRWMYHKDPVSTL